jgi:hypothetical protein
MLCVKAFRLRGLQETKPSGMIKNMFVG